jgi:LPXTG-motif cell wall-anchored protein
MCGCSSNFAGDEGLNFSGNRPSIVEVGEGSSFDFVGDLDGNTQFDDFLGKKAKARRQERRALKKGEVAPTDKAPVTEAEMDKNTYGSSSWISNNWIYLVIGVAVIGGGYYYYKKRK